MFPLVGYALLFVVIGAGFIFIHLVIGKLIRPNRPHAEKETIYECGEPTIGSAWIQFDLRFYVVALLFVIFDVEVAFFFPWAVVFGQANAVAQVSEEPTTDEERIAYEAHVRQLAPLAAGAGSGLDEQTIIDNKKAAQSFAWFAFWDIVVFFGVLLMGFAYLWKRGDLAWVRSVTTQVPANPPPTRSEEQVLVGAS